MSGIIGIDITSESFNQFIGEANGEDIQVNLASLGGFIDVAFEMYNALVDYSGNTKVILNGTVASAAAYLASGFKEVEARENSIFMIHNAMGGAYGDYRDLQKESDVLKGYNPGIADSYANKSGKKREDILAMMDNETWLFGQDIVDAGFADSIVKAGNKSDSEEMIENAKKNFIKMRHNIGDQFTYKRVALANDQHEQEENNNHEETGVMNKEELLKRLNVLRDEGQLKFQEVVNALGAMDQVVNDEHMQSVKIVNELKSLFPESDVIESVKNLVSKEEENKKLFRQNKLDSLFGKENNLRDYAEKVLDDLSDESIENFKKDKIALALAAELADETSPSNFIGELDKKGGAKNTGKKQNRVEA